MTAIRLGVDQSDPDICFDKTPMNHTNGILTIALEVQDREDQCVENLSKLLDFQSNACRSFRDYKADRDPAQRSNQIKVRSAYYVWMDASTGDADSCLELGLR